METLTADEARRLFLGAQGLLGAPDRAGGVPGVLRRMGAVQLDTISVLARSHELVAYARLGAVGRARVEQAYWGGDAFEYWAHAACVLPMESWPLFAQRRRAMRERSRSALPAEVMKRVRAALAAGPVTASDLGGAKSGGVWWDWSPVKVALERLLWWGEAVCVTRESWRRVYDLAERVIPPALLAQERSDEECRIGLLADAGKRLGVATRRDLADYYRFPLKAVDDLVSASGLVPVEVKGWADPAWADPGALDALRAGTVRGRHRTTLLSPFDPVVWDRARTQRMFGFTHRLEAYTPKPKRVHGYFVMPLLAGGRLMGRVDPAREGRTLVARQASVATPSAVPALVTALVEAATCVGCDAVAVERFEPAHLRPALDAALRSAT